MKKRWRARIIPVVVLSLSIAFGVLAESAEASNPSYSGPYINAGRCAKAYASVNDFPYDNGFAAENLIYTEGCGGISTWQRNWQAVDVTLYSAPYPNPSVCAYGGHHPTDTSLASYVLTGATFIPAGCNAFFLYGCYWVATYSKGWTFIGFPGTWYSGDTITDFWPWYCP